MWNEAKQKQLDEYRQREEEGTLSNEERSILAERLIEVEEAESAILKPALEQNYSEQKELQVQIDHVRSQNQLLVTLAEQYEDVLSQARNELAKLQDKQNLLRKEYQRVLQTTSA